MCITLSNSLSLFGEPNLNLFPTAIQNGHINLIIRCVIRLADERLSLDGIKSVLPPLCGPTPCYKIGKGVGDGTFWRRERVADVVVVAVATLGTSSGLLLGVRSPRLSTCHYSMCTFIQLKVNRLYVLKHCVEVSVLK